MKKNPKPKAKGKTRSKHQRRALKLGLVLTVVSVLWAIAGVWYVHHPRQWLIENNRSLPGIVAGPLLWIGNPLGDLTDALDLTGHDAVYEYDIEAPSGSVAFAGYPRRVGAPAPADIRVITRGEFTIGWSDTLRHPLWVAYHVKAKAKYEYNEKRPNFAKDRAVESSAAPGDYAKSGYDRGHMAPNYAIVTRYGPEAQKLTFQMSNIAPQSPSLNRGVWRDVEHRIAEYWTARYGEIWVVVGCIPSVSGLRLGAGVDIPDSFYQVIIAQEKMDVRAVAMIFSQKIPYSAYPTANIISISELEQLTGLDFNPDLPSFIQSPLEAEVPTRLWPIRLKDALGFAFRRFYQ